MFLYVYASLYEHEHRAQRAKKYGFIFDIMFTLYRKKMCGLRIKEEFYFIHKIKVNDGIVNICVSSQIILL